MVSDHTPDPELRRQLRKAIERRDAIVQELEEARASVAKLELLGEVGYQLGIGERRSRMKRLEDQLALENGDVTRFTDRLLDDAVDTRRAARDDRDFWFRRFIVSLQVGNGAAFLATITGLLHADARVLPEIAALVWPPLAGFGIGVAAAGLLPLVMSRVRGSNHPVGRSLARFAVTGLTTISIGFFSCGLWAVMIEVNSLRQPAMSAASTMPNAAQAHLSSKPAITPARRP